MSSGVLDDWSSIADPFRPFRILFVRCNIETGIYDATAGRGKGSFRGIRRISSYLVDLERSMACLEYAIARESLPH